MRIALVSEGTYPFDMGGVSVWCDQLIRGMPGFRWQMVALTVDGAEREVWPRPSNLDAVVTIPLWGPRTPGSGPRGRPGAAFRSAYQTLLDCLLTPLEPYSEGAALQRSRFLLALRGLYQYAAQGGDLCGALLSNQALTLMMDAWHDIRADETSHLTLADAAEATWLIEHMMRPLSAPPVRADVVHSSMNGLAMLVAMAAKWAYDTPILLSEHGIYLRERYISYLHANAPHPVKVLILSFFRSLAGAAYLLADALAPHSSYNRRWQLRNGADPERMWTMYNGVEPDDFPSADTEPAEPTITFMGRIDPLKDLHTLIRAFALVRERVPDARLRIFGGTPAINAEYRDSCQNLIDELGVTAAATLEGRVDHVVEAYHAGTIVALTSISEGFPYTVVEAMACGRTVVCTNVGGVAEAVADTGIVVPPRDHVAVADACVRLLTDEPERRRLAGLARERVMRRFTLDQSLVAYRELYEKLVSPVPPRATIPGQRGPAGGVAVPAGPGPGALRHDDERGLVNRPVGRARVPRQQGRAPVSTGRHGDPP